MLLVLVRKRFLKSGAQLWNSSHKVRMRASAICSVTPSLTSTINPQEFATNKNINLVGCLVGDPNSLFTSDSLQTAAMFQFPIPCLDWNKIAVLCALRYRCLTLFLCSGSDVISSLSGQLLLLECFVRRRLCLCLSLLLRFGLAEVLDGVFVIYYDYS